jgi:hypothetical protein
MSMPLGSRRRIGVRSKGRWRRNVLGCLAVLAVGLSSVVAVAPAARVATCALTAVSPPSFGSVPVAQFEVQEVQVTNTGATALQLDLRHSSNSGALQDFFPEPAFRPSPASCLDQNLDPVSIPRTASARWESSSFPLLSGRVRRG